MLKVIFLFAILLIPLQCLADVCPTPLEISVGNYDLWQPLNLYDGAPLSDEDREIFQSKVRIFAFAEWMASSQDRSGHCFYEGDNSDGSYLGTYLSKENLRPLSPGWKVINENVMRCNVDLPLCLFDVS